MTEKPANQDHLTVIRELVNKLVARANDPLATDALDVQARVELLAAALEPDHDQEERLTALYEVSRALGSSLQMDEVLNQAMDAVIQLTEAERGFLMLLDPISGELDLQAARNFERKSLDREDMQVSRTVIQEVMRTGEGVVTTNAQTDSRFSEQESVMHYALRSILCVPLRVRGEITGVVYVDNKIKTGLFDEGDRELMEAFAAQAAVAIQNARLYTQTDEALTERVSELETLQRIDRQLNTGLDFDRVLELTLDWAVRGTKAQTGWIAIRSEEDTSMIIAAGEGKGMEIDVNNGRLIPAVQHGEVVSHTEETDPPITHLVTPAFREGKAIALIGVTIHGEADIPDAVAFLQRLAEHAAVAIENTRLYKAVQQANMAKSQFVSVVSHELRVPMTSIRGYADLICSAADTPLSDQQMQFIDTIRSNVDRMDALVSDLSDISRIETGQLKISIKDVHLEQCIRNAVAHLQPQIDAKKHRLSIDVAENIPAASTDRDRLTQILTNILSNAIKYTPEAGTVMISAQLDEDHNARISVTDTGIGMSEEDLADLFTQFFRSKNPAVREQSGWGLGLNVTKHLVELLGGEIGAESMEGKGSTFWFTIPIAR